MENTSKHIAQKDNQIIEDVCFDAFYIDESLIDSSVTNGLLLEGKNIRINGTHNWYRIDSPNGEPSPGNLRHMHGYVERKGNLVQIFAVCVDGSGHDGCHQTRIPQVFVDILKSKGFVLPKDNLIEAFVVPQYTNGYTQLTNNPKTINSNIQIGNIYVIKLLMNVPFPFACVRVTDLKKDTENNTSVVEYEIDIAGSVSTLTMPVLLFRLVCSPFILHHILLEHLGFVCDGDVYSKVINTAPVSELFLRKGRDCFFIDKEMNGIRKQISNTRINSLDGLQSSCKQLFNVTFKIDFPGINHILILIKDLDRYLNKVTNYIKQNGYCPSNKVPYLLSDNANIPMSQIDCDLILSYAKSTGLIKEDIINMQYLSYVLV